MIAPGEVLTAGQKAARTRAANRAAAQAASSSPAAPADRAPTAEPGRLHRIHAAPTTGKGGRSFELGGYRWRPAMADKGALDAGAIAYRIALCWNLAEGIRTEALEAGALPLEADAVEQLVAGVERGAPTEELVRMAAAVRAAGGRVEACIDRTEGRLHDCEACMKKTPAAT
jgi:hypothetical protein